VDPGARGEDLDVVAFARIASARAARPGLTAAPGSAASE